MGITRRMIITWKNKKLLLFLQNIWKCTFFSHFHFKIAKSALLTKKKLNISIWVSKKHRILSWFQIRWRLKQMPLKKARAQQNTNLEYFLVFWVIIALFWILKCKWQIKCIFWNIFQEVKSYFWPKIYYSPCHSYWNSKKSKQFKPPTIRTSRKAHFLQCFCRFQEHQSSPLPSWSSGALASSHPCFFST